MGRYWNKGNTPPVSGNVFRKELGQAFGEAYIQYNNGNITLHDQTGTTTLGNILNQLAGLNKKVKELEAKI